MNCCAVGTGRQPTLTSMANEHTRGFCFGMRQRLGIAAVLLADPHLVVTRDRLGAP